MDYNYEALDDKRFQKLCQALIVAQFPDVQCLPIGEADGGRDAFVLREYSGNKSIHVFQVKFSQNPDTPRARNAISALVKSEQENVKRLIADGVSSYYFITNVKGTAYSKRGSIDRVNEFLTQSFNIPCRVWWRDDLDRRLEQFGDIKWSYPEILKGSDVLGLLTAHADDSAQEKFDRTVKIYLSNQYHNESEVKFKQVDLRHKLTELFVDLPLSHKAPLPDQRIFQSGISVDSNDIKSYLNQLRFYEDNGFGNGGPFEHSGLVAAFLFTMPLSIKTSRIVLEGAPGQGKSTVTQFLCQVHRIRLLHKFNELRMVSSHIKYSPIRIPFKLDLRDYAMWLSGRDPFHIGTHASAKKPKYKSLEKFLLMHIKRNTGGLSVNHDRLMEFLNRSHVVIVLDGLDEVADVAIRKQIVDEVCQASERLEAQSKSMQFIITSRPTAFSGAVGFREDEWTHLKLNDLRPSNIMGYKDKWIRAQRLNDEEQQLISETLEKKLEQSHFRDLARNPMQLAILLHLIHVLGVALPENRTALYAEYIKQFFNREAKKSSIVRDNRELLLSIHGALAWDLHTQVEAGKGSGRMSESALRKRVKEFLETEGHGKDLIDLVDQLMQGTVERICALVSRVSGTFEFEVQPLREYFTARQLYKTAPYSPPGRQHKGARSDRFEALAQSAFWTNVTRFYCGFHDRGELSSLVDAITDLGDREGYDLINHSRRLAIMLLSDHVFSQVPRVTDRLMKFVTCEPGFQRFYSAGPPRSRREVELPEKAGRSMLFQTCSARLEAESDPCRRRALREIMAENADKQDLMTLWKSRYQSGAMICNPLHEAEEFGVIDAFPAAEIRDITRGDPKLCVRWFTWLCRYATISEDPELYKIAVDLLFDGELQPHVLRYDREPSGTAIETLQSHLDPFFISALFSSGDGHLHDGADIDFLAWSSPPARRDKIEGSGSAQDSIGEFADFVASMRERSVVDLKQHLFSWSEVVDRGFAEVPGNFMMARLAVIAVAGKSRSTPGVWSDEEFAPTAGLMSRLFYARRKASDVAWWRTRLGQVTDESKPTCLAALVVWGMPDSASALDSETGKMIEGLPMRDWRRVRSMVRYMVRAMGERRPSIGKERFGQLCIHSARLAHVMISLIDDLDVAREMSRMAFGSYTGTDIEILRNAFNLEIFQKNESAVDWEYVLRLSLQSHAAGACSWFSGRELPQVPARVAAEVLRNCTNHCLGLISVCEAAYSNVVAQDAPKLARLAAAEKWFETPY